jgi:hypothetical protein
MIYWDTLGGSGPKVDDMYSEVVKDYFFKQDRAVEFSHKKRIALEFGTWFESLPLPSRMACLAFLKVEVAKNRFLYASLDWVLLVRCVCIRLRLASRT